MIGTEGLYIVGKANEPPNGVDKPWKTNRQIGTKRIIRSLPRNVNKIISTERLIGSEITIKILLISLTPTQVRLTS